MKGFLEIIQKNVTNYLRKLWFHFWRSLFYPLEDNNNERAAATAKYLIAKQFYSNFAD